ncbi:MAG: cytoplasmic protein [Devosia sp.]|uniref:DUF1788 domain-containing protein n=1 Tax=Devosia sp. TaxID=1871048 RepID=UPI002633F7C1|nr:DUF1788 domain-containing protein [Devosia sp.]MDB5531488.1 cytoplasmic protein [Devosia sp.]
MTNLDARLNSVLDRITSDDFLESRGLSGDMPFWVFDYPPEREEDVRKHVESIVHQAPKKRQGLKLSHVNLLELVRDILTERKFLDKSYAMQKAKGTAATLNALRGPLDAQKVARALVDRCKPTDTDVVLVSGVGSAYPLVRVHNLLNALQPHFSGTPLVFFYPGIYDGQTLRLFGELSDKPYYRAFRLAQ